MRKRSGRPPRFAAIPNETVDDAVQLDFMALSLLTVLLRHRDGWDITLEEIGEKYGYGEDAMAGAMGLLQVARYVVKVRIMQRVGNLWSTDVAVYDVPATDEDVEELLVTIREEQPDARRIEVVPPTKTALAKAAKRRAKLAPRVREFPDSGVSRENRVKPQVVPDSGVSRDPGDPGVSKKTVSKKTREDNPAPAARAVGDARRAPAGSSASGREGGFAAAGGAGAPKQGAAGSGSKGRRQVPLTPDQSAAVDLVSAAWPAELAELLPAYSRNLPEIRAAVLAGLAGGRTGAQLVVRVKRRWYEHGYARDAAPGGRGLDSAVGVAVGLVIPSTDCPEPLCEDGTLLLIEDSTAHTVGGPCRTCAQRREDRKAARRAGQVPGPRAGSPAAQWWDCCGTTAEGRPCEATGKGSRPADGLCWKCHDLAEAEEIERGTAGLLAQRNAEYVAQAELVKAAAQWTLLLDDAYAEHAEREAVKSAAVRARRAAEAQEVRRLREQLAREHTELAAYAHRAEEQPAEAPF
ncbi:hypothetical protein OS965_38180 [Streptomyces sp. H27-G5]|uniref:hypothetical protein n=1 Tax=Streptomyces sp. H27-G5 TaxID=2996698 RepID=UPI00227183A3|nr:hypothetical protein [Streptomyces sp. H27-G5]MCY0923895.1 hypothetical protein [Streptomyces sp. H27-G5]